MKKLYYFLVSDGFFVKISLMILVLSGCVLNTDKDIYLDVEKAFKNQFEDYTVDCIGSVSGSLRKVDVHRNSSLYLITGSEALPKLWSESFKKEIIKQMMNQGCEILSKDPVPGVRGEVPPNTVNPYPSSEGSLIVFSFQGSKGIVNIRGTTCKTTTYLSVDIIRFRG